MNRRPVVSLFVLAAWLSAAPAFAQRKPPNFGGIPKALLERLVGEFSGDLAPGITLELASDVLVRLIQEEHAAANAGPGVAGFMDAFTRLAKIETGLENVKKATEAEKPARVADLSKAIDDLGKLWVIGPVLPGFFTENPREEEGEAAPVPPLE